MLSEQVGTALRYMELKNYIKLTTATPSRCCNVGRPGVIVNIPGQFPGVFFFVVHSAANRRS
jgi:hypothetical protein